MRNHLRLHSLQYVVIAGAEGSFRIYPYTQVTSMVLVPAEEDFCCMNKCPSQW